MSPAKMLVAKMSVVPCSFAPAGVRFPALIGDKEARQVVIGSNAQDVVIPGSEAVDKGPELLQIA